MGESLLEHARSTQLRPVTGEDVRAMAATLGMQLPAESRALFLARLACYILHPPTLAPSTAGTGFLSRPSSQPMWACGTLDSSRLVSALPLDCVLCAAVGTPSAAGGCGVGGDGGGGAILC